MMFHNVTDNSVAQYRRRVQDLIGCRVLAPASDYATVGTIMTDSRSPQSLRYNARPAFSGAVLLGALVAISAGCGDSNNGTQDMGPGDTGPELLATGTECEDTAACGGGVCLRGFERLGAEEFDGSLFPDGYCSQDTCTANADCGENAGCLTRPDDLGGVCLRTCSGPSDCRDGYTCAVAAGSTDTRTFCVFEELDVCAHNAVWEEPGTCILRYAIAADGAQFQITATSAGLGNATFDVGPGEVVIRTTANTETDTPMDGPAGVLCHDIRQNFRNMQGVITYTRGSAVSTTSAVLASGTLATDVLTWDTCTYSDTYGDGPSSWTPADTATGPGCLANYTSTGDVNCAAPEFVCNVGNLEVGHNIQDGMWIQPLNSFEFGTELGTLTMGGLDQPPEATVDDKVEIPNSSPSRTYLGFTATLVSTTCY